MFESVAAKDAAVKSAVSHVTVSVSCQSAAVIAVEQALYPGPEGTPSDHRSPS